MKSADCFQRFRVELTARSAVEASTVRVTADGKRSGQLFVPAAEKRAEQTDFAAENRVCAIDNRLRDGILFKNCLHIVYLTP